jgi:hypothetical protein
MLSTGARLSLNHIKMIVVAYSEGKQALDLSSETVGLAVPLLFSSCLTLAKLLKLFQLHFLCISNGTDNVLFTNFIRVK